MTRTIEFDVPYFLEQEQRLTGDPETISDDVFDALAVSCQAQMELRAWHPDEPIGIPYEAKTDGTLDNGARVRSFRAEAKGVRYTLSQFANVAVGEPAPFYLVRVESPVHTRSDNHICAYDIDLVERTVRRIGAAGPANRLGDNLQAQVETLFRAIDRGGTPAEVARNLAIEHGLELVKSRHLERGQVEAVSGARVVCLRRSSDENQLVGLRIHDEHILGEHVQLQPDGTLVHERFELNTSTGAAHITEIIDGVPTVTAADSIEAHARVGNWLLRLHDDMEYYALIPLRRPHHLAEHFVVSDIKQYIRDYATED